MRTTVLLVLLALAGAAAAQTPAPQPPVATAARAVRDLPSTRDPRACLEFPTREQVIACAEKYRPRRPAANP
jgi:hypothetical protein